MKLYLAFASSAVLAMSCGVSNAQQVTGSIDSTITLLNACEVNGSASVSSVDFGLLDFGTHSPFFSEATTQLQSGSASAIEIRCAPGSDATLTIEGGQNDNRVNGSGRAMANGGTYLPYDIYADAGFQNVLASGTEISVTADGNPQLIAIHGRALGVNGLVPGTYNDTISVTLDF